MGDLTDPITSGLPGAQLELEIMAARRSFAMAQQLLAGGPISGLPSQKLTVGWHGSSVNSESGSFALIDQSSGLDDLIGEVVSIAYAGATIYAYVLTAADLPAQMTVTRRLYLAMNRLTIPSITCDVQAVQA